MGGLDYSTPEATKVLSNYEKLKIELDNQMSLWEEGTEVLLELD